MPPLVSPDRDRPCPARQIAAGRTLAILELLSRSHLMIQDLMEEQQLLTISTQELRLHRGKSGGSIYIAVKGVVYDVTTAGHLYGPGELPLSES